MSVSSSRRRTCSSPRVAGPVPPPAPGGAIVATIAAGVRRTICDVGTSGTRSTIAAWPAMSPPAGMTPTVVTPPLRAGARCTLAGLKPSHTVNAAEMPSSPDGITSRVSATAPISTTPSCVAAFTRPGVTHLPVASTRCAPAGMATSRPTAAMRPSRMSTVPFSMRGPLTGYTVPPVMAIVCAAAAEAARSAAVGSARSTRAGRISGSLRPARRARSRARSRCATAAPGRGGRRGARRRSTPSRRGRRR